MLEKPKRVKKAKKKAKRLTVVKVQEAVNAAIRERDGTCMVRDGRHECAGCLTASHFYAKGGNSCLRFYPLNIWTQCLGHHGIHERNHDPAFYHRWMEAMHPGALAWMESVRGRVVKYSQPVLTEIKALADARDLDGLEAYTRKLFELN